MTTTAILPRRVCRVEQEHSKRMLDKLTAIQMPRALAALNTSLLPPRPLQIGNAPRTQFAPQETMRVRSQRQRPILCALSVLRAQLI